jgi:threonine synthase
VAQRDLAGEGIFADPASATALAGLRNIARTGALPPGQRIALVNTSSGLKNLEALRSSYREPETRASSLPPVGPGVGAHHGHA